MKEIAEATIKGMDREFYIAALEGNKDAFKDKGNEIENILTPQKNTILHVHLTAYSDGVSETFLEYILSMCPALVMKSNAEGETLLHIAARYGHSTVVNMLIKHAKDLSTTSNNNDEVGNEKLLIRAINEKKNTALHLAVCFHHIEIVEILTKEDPSHPYFGNGENETPLYLAAERAYWDVMLKILETCTSPINQDGPNGRTALHAVVLCNDKEMVSNLLTRTRTSAKQADENGLTPLHLAAFHRSADVTEVLLKHDRETAYMRDKRGRTALHIAARCGNEDVIEMILEHCPDCSELVDENGYNALHYTAVSKVPSAANAAAMILDNGFLRVDTMAFNKNKQTAIDVAFDDPFFHSEVYFIFTVQV